MYHTKFLSLLFIVNVDQYLKHQNDKTKTDALIHFVNFRDNSIMEVDQVLRMIDYKTEELDPIFKEKIHKIVQKRLKMERDLLKNIIYITISTFTSVCPSCPSRHTPNSCSCITKCDYITKVAWYTCF